MGCLNSTRSFQHWFANIHLSGPCNRTCPFCIGNYMPHLQTYNNLNTWPLHNLEQFIAKVKAKGITEINLTGTNTDPTLYQHHEALTQHLRSRIPGATLGIRTNGVHNLDCLRHYDKGSFSITSLDPTLYATTMGNGTPPNIQHLREITADKPWKINICLTQHHTLHDVLTLIDQLAEVGYTTINLRELYGSPHTGDILAPHHTPVKTTFGNPTYQIGESQVTYWDVHYTEVESINLYANGRISLDYPVTKGYHPLGKVHDQDWFQENESIAVSQGLRLPLP